MAAFILASQSPQRKKLLSELLSEFIVQPADIDETELPDEDPYAYCARVARGKAQKIAKEDPDAYVLAADTPVVVGRESLQTSWTKEEAERMLRCQSGQVVHIPTAVCLITPEGQVYETVARSSVTYDNIPEAALQRHLADENNWKGVSGGLKLTNHGTEAFLKHVEGSFSGIIGLPLYQTKQLLIQAGVLP